MADHTIDFRWMTIKQYSKYAQSNMNISLKCSVGERKTQYEIHTMLSFVWRKMQTKQNPPLSLTHAYLRTHTDY